jgi:hypothetical protein
VLLSRIRLLKNDVAPTLQFSLSSQFNLQVF